MRLQEVFFSYLLSHFLLFTPDYSCDGYNAKIERSSCMEMASKRRPSLPVTVVACNKAFNIASSVASTVA